MIQPMLSQLSRALFGKCLGQAFERGRRQLLRTDLDEQGFVCCLLLIHDGDPVCSAIGKPSRSRLA